jgi:hypothetical protein
MMRSKAQKALRELAFKQRACQATRGAGTKKVRSATRLPKSSALDGHLMNGHDLFERANDPNNSGPALKPGTILNTVCVVVDLNGVIWRIDPSAGTARQVFRVYRRKGCDEIEVGSRIFREIKDADPYEKDDNIKKIY